LGARIATVKSLHTYFHIFTLYKEGYAETEVVEEEAEEEKDEEEEEQQEEEEEEEEKEESLFKADAVNEQDSERDRAT